MRFSRLGIFLILGAAVLVGSNCSYYNRVMVRKNLVDGAKAYKDRKFAEAETLFRYAASKDPNGETIEGRTAQLSLARTLHSMYIGNRTPSFGESDYKGDDGLLLQKRIWAKGDAVSQFLFDQISPETKKTFDDYNKLNPSSTDMDQIKAKTTLKKSFFSGLSTDLNKVINGPSIYDASRFNGITLSDLTKQIMASNPAAEKLARLNRLLLEDAFPNEIAKKPRPEDALAEYKKSLGPGLKDLKEATDAYNKNPNSEPEQKRYFQSLSAINSSTTSIASLYDNLQQQDNSRAWQMELAGSADYPPTARARALSALAAKSNTCANEISDTEATKKTVTKDNKQTYQFVKPAKQEDFDQLRKCVDEGTKLIDQANALEPDSVKNAASLNISGLSDTALQLNSEILRSFESTRSYKASMTVQAMRVAEMEGKTADKDRLKTQADADKAKYIEISDVVKKIEAEVKKRADEKEAADKREAANKSNSKK